MDPTNPVLSPGRDGSAHGHGTPEQPPRCLSLFPLLAFRPALPRPLPRLPPALPPRTPALSLPGRRRARTRHLTAAALPRASVAFPSAACAWLSCPLRCFCLLQRALGPQVLSQLPRMGAHVRPGVERQRMCDESGRPWMSDARRCRRTQRTTASSGARTGTTEANSITFADSSTSDAARHACPSCKQSHKHSEDPCCNSLCRKRLFESTFDWMPCFHPIHKRG
jgi:hypothetical protein